MALRGIEKVIRSHKAEPGRFYMHESYSDRGAHIFLCFLTGQEVKGSPEKQAAYVNDPGEQKLQAHPIPDGETLIELPEVHVRGDAASLSATQSSSHIRPGMLIVLGDQALISVGASRGSRYLIEVATGGVIEPNPSNVWASFSRWKLVTGDGDNEVPILEFDDSDSAGNPS